MVAAGRKEVRLIITISVAALAVVFAGIPVWGVIHLGKVFKEFIVY